MLRLGKSWLPLRVARRRVGAEAGERVRAPMVLPGYRRQETDGGGRKLWRKVRRLHPTVR